VRVKLQALGCRLNEAELQTWARELQQQGHLIASDQEAADLVVINTCAVTVEAERKSRKLLRRARRDNPQAKLVVSGCYATLEGEYRSRSQEVDLLVPNRNKDRLVEIAARELDLGSIPNMAIEPDTNPLFARGRQRAFVKVQDGCRYRCTFCIVTLARGEERSRPIADVVDEINNLSADGVKEIVLTGVHLGGYGSERGSGLASLIRAVLADTDVPRVRMGSLEPWDLPDQLWELFDDQCLMPHLHLPLQSGSDAVLRRMARRCRTEDFACLAAKARQLVPDINLTTDIIVGFPGETQAEWQETMSFVESQGFGHIHIFPYSPREGTKAATLREQIGNETKKERSRQLQKVARSMKRQALERFVGRRFPVLIEGRYAGAPDGDWFGYTPNYLPVRVSAGSSQNPVNQILDVKLVKLHQDGESLLGC